MAAPKRAAASGVAIAHGHNKKAKTSPAANAMPRSILKKPSNGSSGPSIGLKNARHDRKEAEGTMQAKAQPGRASNGQVKGKGRVASTSDAVGPLELTPSLASIPAKPAIAFELVAGSYERILYGVHCTPSGAGATTTVDMQAIFQFPAHLTSVKCAAASPNGRWLVTGSTDDVVKVWDFRRRKEVGGLVGHDGDITCLTFPSDKYLVSASADGTLCFFRTKDWSLLRRFKGHKGKINHVAVHPQGRVALTVSKDRCLRLWDLLGKGTGKDKGSTSTRLGAEGDVVRWNTNGDRFAVILDREIRLYTTNMAVIKTLTSRSRFHDIAFVDLDGVEILLVACDDGKVRVYKDLTLETGSSGQDGDDEDEEAAEIEPSHFAELVGHTNRVKALCIVTVLGQQLCTTISSDGTIKVFALSAVRANEKAGSTAAIQELEASSSYDTKGSRLTCLTAVAVKDDRTTYADSVAPSDDDHDDDDSDSESESDSELESVEGSVLGEDDEEDAEAEAEAGADDLDSEEGAVDGGGNEEEEDEEWGGIGTN